MNSAELRQLCRWGHAISCAGVVLFVCLCGLAMLLYPGGTRLDPTTSGYSFFANYLSDLGTSESWSGESNATSAALFNGSLLLLGLAIVPFFALVPTHAPDRSELLSAVTLFGLVSAAAVVGLGLTPYDRFFREHNLLLTIWAVSSLIATSLHFVALATSEESQVFLSVFSLLPGVAIGHFILSSMDDVLASVLFSATPHLEYTIAAQKYVFFLGIAWFFIFSVRAIVAPNVQFPEREPPDLPKLESYVLRVEPIHPGEFPRRIARRRPRRPISKKAKVHGG